MVHEKRLNGISDLRDESDRRGMRIVIELKRDVNPNVLLNHLYKHTQMQDTFSMIMLALVDGQPRVLSLKQMLYHYVEHRKDVVVRRTKYDLERAQARAHILEGLLIALDHIDEVIRIIRSSDDDAQARARLIEAFSFSDKQAQAILDMRLRRLTGLESARLRAELGRTQRKDRILSARIERRAAGAVHHQGRTGRSARPIRDERRSEIMPVEGEVDIEDLIDSQDMCITLTHFGYIKRLPADTYDSQHRGEGASWA